MMRGILSRGKSLGARDGMERVGRVEVKVAAAVTEGEGEVEGEGEGEGEVEGKEQAVEVEGEEQAAEVEVEVEVGAARREKVRAAQEGWTQEGNAEIPLEQITREMKTLLLLRTMGHLSSGTKRRDTADYSLL